eukprot:403331123
MQQESQNLVNSQPSPPSQVILKQINSQQKALKDTSPSSNTFLILKKQNQYTGVSQIYNKRRRGNGDQTSEQEFQARFKGKTTLMNKDGHIGIVQSTIKPIAKGTDSTPQQKQSDYLNHSASQQDIVNYGNGGNEVNSSIDFSTIGYKQTPEINQKPFQDFQSKSSSFKKDQERHRRNHQSTIPTSSTMGSMMDLQSISQDKNYSPLRRVGSTITTSSMSANQNGVIGSSGGMGVGLPDINSHSVLNSGQGNRFDHIRNSVQVINRDFGINQGVFYQRAASNQMYMSGTPLLIPINLPPNQGNNVAVSSFYSHQPIVTSSGYSSNFGGGIIIQNNSGGFTPSPMFPQHQHSFDAGFGSFTSNFSRPQGLMSQPLQQSYYQDLNYSQVNPQSQGQILSRSSFRSIQNQPQQTNYMQTINNNGASKYQEFINQINRQKLDSINKQNHSTPQRSQSLTYDQNNINNQQMNNNQAQGMHQSRQSQQQQSPQQVYSYVSPMKTHKNLGAYDIATAYESSPAITNNLQTKNSGAEQSSINKNRRNIKLAKSIEVTSLRRPLQVPV